MELITDLTKPIPVKYNYTSTALKNFMLCGFKLKNKKFNRKQKNKGRFNFNIKKLFQNLTNKKREKDFDQQQLLSNRVN